jgi:hypothetical protein
VKIVKNERDPVPLTSKLLVKFQNILRNATQVKQLTGEERRILSFLVGTISNVLVMKIGWTDVGSGGISLN